MERDLAGSRKVREYLVLSDRYLEAAETLVGSKNWEPAMANVLHSIDVSIKAALSSVVKG